jgi:hypothetical protein
MATKRYRIRCLAIEVVGTYPCWTMLLFCRELAHVELVLRAWTLSMRGLYTRAYTVRKQLLMHRTNDHPDRATFVHVYRARHRPAIASSVQREPLAARLSSISLDDATFTERVRRPTGPRRATLRKESCRRLPRAAFRECKARSSSGQPMTPLTAKIEATALARFACAKVPRSLGDARANAPSVRALMTRGRTGEPRAILPSDRTS